MMHLSRFSEEIILWNSNEYRFVEIDDAYSTGSSIMPQKKNPDIAELVRGKTGRVYGALTSILTTMKGIPLAYNKDMQEDKELTFDAIDTVKGCIALFTGMVSTMQFNKANMEQVQREALQTPQTQQTIWLTTVYRSVMLTASSEDWSFSVWIRESLWMSFRFPSTKRSVLCLRRTSMKPSV